MSAYILVVESDTRLQKQITDALREARYELASEAEISWAKRSLASRRPDAVVLDTALSDGSGFGLANSLRAAPDTAGVPLFFVASKARGAAHRTEAMRRFAPADYFSTPLDVDSLLIAVLQRLPPDMPAAAGEQPHPSAAPTAAAPISPAKLADPEQRREGRAVEKSAKDLVGAAAAFRGNLKKTSFAWLLHKLYAERAQGALLLLRDDVKKIVSFVEGYPVSVRSNVLGECLGQILLGKKLISPEILTESVRRMKTERRRQGEILVEMGVLSPFNLSRALVEQMESKLFDIFAWQDGQFMFQDKAPPPGSEAVRLERSTAALILEGIRRHYDQARQAAVLEAFIGRYVRLTSNPVLRFQEMTSDAGEVAFISGIDGSTKVETLLDRASIPRPKAILLLVAMAEAGIIEPTDGPAARRASSSQKHQTQVTPVPTGEPEPLSPTQLTLVLDTLATQNHFVALGIRPDSSQAELDRAYEVMARKFHADRYRGRPEEQRKLAQRIFDKLAEAHVVLSDAAHRRTYVSKLERSRPAETHSRAVPNAAAEELYKSGMQHLANRRHHDAVESLRQAARLAPNEAAYRAALGWSLFREQPADPRAERAAVAELKRAIQLDGRYRQARLYLSQLYQQTGHTDLAIQELEKVLEFDPTAFEAAEELRRLREAR